MFIKYFLVPFFSQILLFSFFQTKYRCTPIYFNSALLICDDNETMLLHCLLNFAVVCRPVQKQKTIATVYLPALWSQPLLHRIFRSLDHTILLLIHQPLLQTLRNIT